MALNLSDVSLYDHYCNDPTAANCVDFADGALPVYLGDADDDSPVLYPGPGRLDRPYGHLHIFHDDGEAYLIVVRRPADVIAP